MIVNAKVKAYLESLTPARGDVLAEMESYGRERGFPLIGPEVGRLLRLLAQSIGAKRVFECGSGFGYSAMWFSEAVGADGEIFLTDGDAGNIERARDYLGRAGFADRCRVLHGDAVTHLKATPGPFDIVLVDIDKQGYPASLEPAVAKLRSGGLLITDNVLWSGRVADESEGDPDTEAIREYNRMLYAHPDLDTVILPLRDGVAVARKR